MTTASGFKRLGIALAAVAAVAVGAVVTLTALIPTEVVRQSVTDEIRSVTGLDPLRRARMSLSLFPSSEVNFYNISLGDSGSGTPALTAQRLTAHLRMLPLLLGRVEIADVELVRPTVAVTIARGGASNWSGLIDTLARTLKPSSTEASFSEIRIVGGTVYFHDVADGVSERLDNVDLALAWPSISKSFGATGHFVWHDEPIDTSLTLSDFVAALTGNDTGLKLRLSGKPIKVAFDGHLSYAPTLKIDGTVAADAASLRDVLLWAGQKPFPGGGFGRFALKAETKIVAGSVALTGVNVELDGNTAEGVLTISGGKHRLVQGTLAADGLDLTPYVSTVRLMTARDRAWSGAPIGLEGFDSTDLDLRLSAAHVAIRNAKLGRTAVAANLRNGKLTVTVGESQAFGGVIKGSIALGSASAGADIDAQLQFDDVDLESCLSSMFGIHRLEGKGTMTVALKASGGSVLKLTHTMNGTVSLVGQSGALVGLNVEQLLRRLERRPLSGGGDFRTGRTRFDKLEIAFRVRQGTVNVETVKIMGPAVHLALGGSASIPERDLDLKGTATLVAQDTSKQQSPFALPFVVQGPWDDPTMLPDTELLIRRSGAAAPLLNAFRNSHNRESLRSAIERLTGQPTISLTPTQAQ